MIHEGDKLTVPYCDVTRAELQKRKTFQKEGQTLQSPIITLLLQQLSRSLEIATFASVTSQKEVMIYNYIILS